ncbi:hypothetical protein BDF22DRAFT_700174 [Syncephalis plumigaleata]|nr:hypothetical protein BDF22DRAFT_700174 [Syncephalis plumigaleata]
MFQSTIISIIHFALACLYLPCALVIRHCYSLLPYRLRAMILALDNFIATTASTDFVNTPTSTSTSTSTSTHSVSSPTTVPNRRVIIKRKASSTTLAGRPALSSSSLTCSYTNSKSSIRPWSNVNDDEHQDRVSRTYGHRDEATKLVSEMPLRKRRKSATHTTTTIAASNRRGNKTMITQLAPETLTAIFFMYQLSIRVHARHPLDDDAIPVNLPLDTYGQWIRQLDLWPAYSMIRDTTILRFMDACTRLRSISLHGCIFVTDIGIKAIAERCGDTLSAINLSYCVRVTDKGIAAIAQHASHSLEQINLKGCSLVTDYGLQMLSTCHRLRRVRLSELSEITDIGVWAMANGCQQLEWVDLTGSCGCSDASAEAFSKYCPRLNWLSMARIPTIAPESVIHQPQQPVTTPNDNEDASSTPPRLSFAVHCKRPITAGLSDRGLEALAAGCPRLTFLDLSFHHAITDRGVEQLARTACHLVHVALIGCTRATTRSLYALVELRHRYGKMACITMGGTPQFDEETLRQETQSSSPSSAMLRDWKRADATGYSSRNLPGLSWLDTW